MDQKEAARALWFACQKGDAERAKAILMENTVDVNAKPETAGVSVRDTALHACAKYGHSDAARLLLDVGASVDTTNLRGETPLFYACQHGHLEVASVLLNAGAKVNTKSKEGKTPLQVACQGCHIETVALLLDRGSELYSGTASPLSVAAGLGDEATVRLLLNRGADANLSGPDGRSPLHSALTPQIARLLLDRGASASAVDKVGRTPLHGAEDGTLPVVEVAQLLMDSGCAPAARDQLGNTPLHYATGSRLATVKLLLTRGVPVHAANKKGSLPLHCIMDREAQRYKELCGDNAQELAVAAALLSAGADSAMKDGSGQFPLQSQRQAAALGVPQDRVSRRAGAGEEAWTALHSAAMLGKSSDVARILADDRAEERGVRGASTLAATAMKMRKMLTNMLDAPSQFGETPLYVAALHSRADAVRLLLEGGADAKCLTKYGQTALHAAAWSGNVVITRLLLAAGVDINAVDTRKYTPLLCSIQRGHFELAGELLDGGAFVNVNYGHGSTLLYAAACHDGPVAPELVRLLMESGANHATSTYTSLPSNGASPLKAAARLGNAVMVKLFIEKGVNVKEHDWAGDIPLDGAKNQEVRRLLRALDNEYIAVSEQLKKEAEERRLREEAELRRKQLQEELARTAAAEAESKRRTEDMKRRMEEADQKRREEAERKKKENDELAERKKRREEEDSRRRKEEAQTRMAAQEAAHRAAAAERRAARMRGPLCTNCQRLVGDDVMSSRYQSAAASQNGDAYSQAGDAPETPGGRNLLEAAFAAAKSRAKGSVVGEPRGDISFPLGGLLLAAGTFVAGTVAGALVMALNPKLADSVRSGARAVGISDGEKPRLAAAPVEPLPSAQ